MGEKKPWETEEGKVRGRSGREEGGTRGTAEGNQHHPPTT